MAGRCIVFDRRSDPMVMESRIVSAPFPISSVTDLSRLPYISLSLFRHDVCHIDSYFHTASRSRKKRRSQSFENRSKILIERIFPVINFSSIFFFFTYTRKIIIRRWGRWKFCKMEKCYALGAFNK